MLPRQMILEVGDRGPQRRLPTANDAPVGKRIVSPQAAYIVTDILSGNVAPRSINPFWGKWDILPADEQRRTRRPAASKTGS